MAPRKDQVERQHVYPGFPEHTKGPPFDELTQAVLRHITGFGHSRHLEEGRCPRNVGIEPALGTAEWDFSDFSVLISLVTRSIKALLVGPRSS